MQGRNAQDRRLILVFVDGLGLAPASANNPITTAVCPELVRLLADARPIDACLGVPGLPQSATGQTALLTGVNAAQRIGRHVEGFPGPQLREIIEEHNIYRQLAAHGLSGTFANTYTVDTVDQIRAMRFQSVTTVAALSGGIEIRRKDRIGRHDGLYHDLTREKMRERGVDVELRTPEQSADDLVRISRGFDFTLFEFFQTDHAGHSDDPEFVEGVLAKLSRFAGRIAVQVDREPGLCVLLTSDHGNIEDGSVRTHTVNPVPLVALGSGTGYFHDRVTNLVDVTPSIVTWLADGLAGRASGVP